MKNRFSAIILAAGKGTRMKSPLPKVLHPVAGVPMLRRVITAVKNAGAQEIRVVVGHGAAMVRQVVEPLGAVCFEQVEQKGTADAVRAANPADLSGPVLIMNGDHPLVTEQDVRDVIDDYLSGGSSLAVVTTELKRPKDFGRIVRHKGQLHSIVEAKDASAETLRIREVNTGIYVVQADILHKYLPEISNKNAKQEYYLTDLIEITREAGERLETVCVKPHVGFGVNSQPELARATGYVFKRKATELMNDGVVLIDPATTYVEDDVQIGEATVVYPNCYMRGQTVIGRFSVIEPNCYLSNSAISDSVQIRAGSYLEEARVNTKAIIGPYARLRPQTEIGVDARVGNFVEMKKVKFGDGAKANHLAYLGDAEVGKNTNIGCGTITCNYAVDRKKYKTTIGSNVFVGSDSQFVAPVSVGDNAVIGSGSTITKDVPAHGLGVARARQVIKENYVKSETPSADESSASAEETR